jgi:hypothetical protein
MRLFTSFAIAALAVFLSNAAILETKAIGNGLSVDTNSPPPPHTNIHLEKRFTPLFSMEGFAQRKVDRTMRYLNKHGEDIAGRFTMLERRKEYLSSSNRVKYEAERLQWEKRGDKFKKMGKKYPNLKYIDTVVARIRTLTATNEERPM